MVRFGAVSYLNAKPLVRFLEPDDEDDIVYDVPSALADELAAGRLDVALIPVVDCFRNPAMNMVPDIGIASRGRVDSVKLYCNRPMEAVRSVLLDRSSRTSAAVLRILMRRAFQKEVEFREHNLDPRAFERQTFDAALLIGDANFKVSDGAFEQTFDLGAVWTELTGLPLVYATWTAREGFDAGSVAGRLRDSLRLGLKNMDMIVAEETASHDLTPDFCRDYLTRRIHYALGPDEYRGMNAFKTLWLNPDAPILHVETAGNAARSPGSPG